MSLPRRGSLAASAAASALAALGASRPGAAAALPAGAGSGGRARAAAGGAPPLVVAGLVIETVPGAAPRVAARLLHDADVELSGGDGDRRLAAVFTGRDREALAAFSARLVGDDREVVAVSPTFVADACADRDPR